MSPRHEIVQVNFRGDIIDAIQTEDGEILVSPIRICDSLGINWASQYTKLKGHPWARIVMITMRHPQDGRIREVTMVPLKIVPMWLANVNVSKVKPGIRAKLLAYQLEVVEVLSAWFLGVSDIPGLADEMKEVKERLSAVEHELSGTKSALTVFRRRFNSLMGREPSTDYMTLRGFVDAYGIKGILGTRFKGSQLRIISRQLNKLSQIIGAEVRKVSHPAFGSVNAYRFDILHGWLVVSNVSNATSPEDFAKLVQGRLFI